MGRQPLSVGWTFLSDTSGATLLVRQLVLDSRRYKEGPTGMSILQFMLDGFRATQHSRSDQFATARGVAEA
jgi:hypothetical protein